MGAPLTTLSDGNGPPSGTVESASLTGTLLVSTMNTLVPTGPRAGWGPSPRAPCPAQLSFPPCTPARARTRPPQACSSPATDTGVTLECLHFQRQQDKRAPLSCPRLGACGRACVWGQPKWKPKCASPDGMPAARASLWNAAAAPQTAGKSSDGVTIFLLIIEKVIKTHV